MYEYNNDLLMKEALAEILDVNIDIIEQLDISIEPNIGRDDILYGYYVQYPAINDNLEKTLTKSIINKIPWGQMELYSEAQFGNTTADPFGWSSDWEDEDYYLKNTPSKENILQQINEIKNKIQINLNDPIIVKSLVFSAYSITESYMRSLVRNFIPDFEDSNIDDSLKNILKRYFSEQIVKNNTQRKLFQDITSKQLKEIPHYKDLRNSLSHNMFAASTTNNGIITIKDRNNNVISFTINDVIDELIEFIKHPLK